MKTALSLSVSVLLGLTLMTAPTNLYALGKAPSQPDSNESSAPALSAREQRALMEGIYQNATQELENVSALITRGEYGAALLAAKNLSDQIKLKTGVNPKVKVRQPILLAKNVLSPQMLRVRFEELPNTAKYAIANAIAQHKHGFFLDLLNYAKRARLYQTQTFLLTLSRDGRLLEEDRKKAIDDILSISRIPILIAQEGLPGEFMLFDSDVADSDQQYLFNRELAVFSEQTLGIKEEAFGKKIEDFMSSTLSLHRAGLPKLKGSAMEEILNSSEFNDCYNKAYRNLPSSAAIDYCQGLGKAGELRWFNSPAFQACWNTAYRNLPGSEAIWQCIAILKQE